MKVFSFSLWGSAKRYLIGAIEVSKQVGEMFPGFECWFYIHNTVPEDIVIDLLKMAHVKVIRMDCDLETSKPMMWRFQAIDHPDCDIMMPRDTDTRFYLREKLAIEEWLKSGRAFHIMRDCPHHWQRIMGGMFGTRKHSWNWGDKIASWKQVGVRDYDQIFLKEVIYPLVVDDIMVHDSFYNYEKDSCKFPMDFDPDFHFVGEYVFEDGSRDMACVNLTGKEWLAKGGNIGPAGLF